MEDYRRMDGATMDPFPLVKEKVQTAVRQLEADMTTWREQLKRTNTYTNQGFQRVNRSVRSQLKKLNSHIKALSTTITAVESQRSRFPNIDDAELDNRKDFVAQTRAVVDGYHKLITDPATKAKKAEDKRKVEDMRSTDVQESDFHTLGNDRFETQQQEQEDFETKQDEVLDDMTTVLGRLGVAAEAIDMELAEHKEYKISTPPLHNH
mmetsp:Transcript_34221/g.66256  ORF Transcript_34221/g.66256 Transcript_34221/m.66256 type:complete len:208 (-) Transcript_34221:526-1149(-)